MIEKGPGRRYRQKRPKDDTQQMWKCVGAIHQIKQAIARAQECSVQCKINRHISTGSELVRTSRALAMSSAAVRMCQRRDERANRFYASCKPSKVPRLMGVAYSQVGEIEYLMAVVGRQP